MSPKNKKLILLVARIALRVFIALLICALLTSDTPLV